MAETSIVLAGGKGTRLRPLTYTRPKPLIPMAGAPVIDYIIDWLQERGFTRFIVAAKYLGEMIKEHYRGRSNIEVVIGDYLDTADAVRSLSEYITEEDILISMGDVVCNALFDKMYRYHIEKESLATIALKEVDNPLHYGLVIIDQDSRIKLFLEKPISLEIYIVSLAHSRVYRGFQYTNLINAGFYMINRQVIDLLNRNRYLMDWGKHVFPYLVENDYPIYAWIMSNYTYWEDLGRVENYKKAVWDLISSRINGLKPRGENRGENLWIKGDHSIKGRIIPPAYIGDGVTIMENAVIGPYVVLENNVVVKKNSKLAYTIVWENTVIEQEVLLYNTVIADNVIVGNNTRIHNSVIGSENNIGSETVIDNEGVPPPMYRK